MNVNGYPHKTIWYDENQRQVVIIDQTLLPHQFKTIALNSLEEFCTAISTMQVRGAPLIGVTAAYGLAFALRQDASQSNEINAAKQLISTRPTAVNLRWAIDKIREAIAGYREDQRAEIALSKAVALQMEDIQCCEAIGDHGSEMLSKILSNKPTNSTLNILTHCNAGWLATVDWGTALAPVYKAHQRGLPIHVWVDETRPRNQGSSLTAWELQQQGIDHTVIADNTGGHLMQHNHVDLCIVGSDRTTADGDVCNKIGTYLKALAAHDNDIPFYVALPSSTIDWSINDGIKHIPIEERDPREVTHITGIDKQGLLREVQLVDNSPVANFAFDVTPAKYITGLITELGIFEANKTSLERLKSQKFPNINPIESRD